jgi:hypothetical protein
VAVLEPNYNQYFSAKKTAFLINISEGRDSEHYESISGTIISINKDVITMRIPYPTGLNTTSADGAQITYKLTSEAMGVGVQILADLINIENDVYHLQLRGNLEMFQQRQTARVDTTIGLYQFRKDASMESYRIMYRQLTGYIKNRGVPTEIQLQDSIINLSASGLRCAIAEATGKTPPPLSMFLLDLGARRPVFCAVAELIWTRDNVIERVAGYRFILISKAARDLIVRYVRSMESAENVENDYKKNWVLLDRMFVEEAGGSGDP